MSEIQNPPDSTPNTVELNRSGRPSNRRADFSEFVVLSIRFLNERVFPYLRSNAPFLFSIILAVLAFTIGFYSNFSTKTHSTAVALAVSIVSLLIISFATFFFRYLDSDEDKGPDDSLVEAIRFLTSERRSAELLNYPDQKRAEAFKQDLELLRSLIDAHKKGIGKSLRFGGAISRGIGAERANVSAVNAETLEESNQRRTSIHSVFLDARDRLHYQIGVLGRRANINLLIGIITTGFAVGILAYTAYAPKIADKNLQSAGGSRAGVPSQTVEEIQAVLPNLVLRVPLAIFIEIFSFFFLKLYRQNLSEVKYYQNEITTLDARFLGIRLLDSNEGKLNTALVIAELLKTERNLILRDGETTVDGERMKLENEVTIRALETAGKALDKVKLTT